jgi:hypothetical protein
VPHAAASRATSEMKVGSRNERAREDDVMNRTSLRDGNAEKTLPEQWRLMRLVAMRRATSCPLRAPSCTRAAWLERRCRIGSPLLSICPHSAPHGHSSGVSTDGRHVGGQHPFVPANASWTRRR